MPVVDLNSLQAPAQGLRLTTELSLGTGRPVSAGAFAVASDPFRQSIAEHGVLALTVSKRLSDRLDLIVGLGAGSSRGIDERGNYVSPLNLGLSYLVHSSSGSRTFVHGEVGAYEPGNFGNRGRFLGSLSLGLSRTLVIDPVYLSYGGTLQFVRPRGPGEFTPYRRAISLDGSLGFAVNHRVQLSLGAAISQTFRHEDPFAVSDRRSIGVSLGAALAHPGGQQTSVRVGFDPGRGDASLSIGYSIDAPSR